MVPAITPVADYRYELAGFTLEQLQARYQFTPDQHGADIEVPRVGTPTRIYDLTFPNLVQAVEFATYVADPGAHTDVWFAHPDRRLDLWDSRVTLSVRFRAQPVTRFVDTRPDHDEVAAEWNAAPQEHLIDEQAEDLYAGTAALD